MSGMFTKSGPILKQPFTFNNCLGVDDHLQPVDASLWIYAMSEESISAPRFYFYSFEFRANQLLAQHLKMKRCDITAENCESVYKFLIIINYDIKL